MKPKKSTRADLRNRRSLFFEIGFIVALAAVISGFAAGTTAKVIADWRLGLPPPAQDIVQIPQTRQEPPKQKALVNRAYGDILKVIPNNKPIVTDYVFAEIDDFVIDLSGFEPEKIPEDDIPLLNPSEPPSFQGGDLGTFRNWVQSRIIYPRVAQENDRQGKVVLKFVIERDGTLTHIEEIASPERLLTEEAVRVLKQSPKWEPGKNRGKPVRVQFILPVEFRLMN